MPAQQAVYIQNERSGKKSLMQAVFPSAIPFRYGYTFPAVNVIHVEEINDCIE
jgi:hypothetical protein